MNNGEVINSLRLIIVDLGVFFNKVKSQIVFYMFGMKTYYLS